MTALEHVLGVGRRNAVTSWLLVALLVAIWLGGVLADRVLWSAFALVVLALAIVPPMAYRSAYVMLPWEVLLLAALPVLGLGLGWGPFTSPVAAYLAVAAVGLVIVVELHSFTAIRLSPGFAVVLVTAATMAAAALWAVVQWGIDLALGREFVTTNDELMIEFFYSTLAGVGAGVIFTAYFRRIDAVRDRLPPKAELEVFDQR
ncbi:hypothetical protein [Natronococcus wangiae]|uniref:hypothetical protein n=1 Tax=Natronococcus wangiae TaxID=3068275 RepID=UPI00273D1E80|nr:hypothetical protein [Natronococcus sp. AD5]